MRARPRAAFTLSFLISAGDYVTPRFVGGGTAMMGNFIERQFSFALQLADGRAMSFSHAGRLARWLIWPFGAARLLPAWAGREGAAVLGVWRVFGAAVVLFMLSPLFLVVLFSFNTLGPDQPAADRPDASTGTAELFANDSFWPALLEQPDRRAAPSRSPRS